METGAALLVVASDASAWAGRQGRRDVVHPGVAVLVLLGHLAELPDALPLGLLPGAVGPRAVRAVRAAAQGTAAERAVLCGLCPKAVKPSSSSPLRSPGSERKVLTHSE